MDVAVRHYLPGRVRLHVPELCRKPALADAALAWLRAQSGVSGARLNIDCASLVVEYDRTREPLLEGILAQLRTISPKQLAAFIGVGTGAAVPAKASPSVPALKPAAKSAAAPTKGDVPALLSSRSPLNLPTLSLLM